MDSRRIAELLQPFLPGHAALTPLQLEQILTYINILLRWNTRINLTAVRQPEEIVARHFGESLFAASHLFPARAVPTAPPVQSDRTPHRDAQEPPGASGQRLTTNGQRLNANDRVLDVGSGSGFPSIPIKIWAPDISLTLIESNHKKATFLREVIRSLRLTNVNVFCERAQDHPPSQADVVTLRAVEHFDSILPAAAALVAPAGRLALLIGRTQAENVPRLAARFAWEPPAPMPASTERILLIGRRSP